MTRLLLAFILLATPPGWSTESAPLGRNITAASLTRAEFDYLSNELQTQSVEVVFARFAGAFHLNEILAAVDNDMNVGGFGSEKEKLDSYIKTWIVSLVLARNGFSDAAKNQFVAGMREIAVKGERWIRVTSFSKPMLDQFLSDVAGSTIVATLESFGYLKTFESDRLKAQLKQSIEFLKSNELTRHAEREVGRIYFEKTSVLLIAVMNAMIAFKVVDAYRPDVASFVADVFGNGLFASLLGDASILAVPVGSGSVAGILTLACAHAIGVCWADPPSFKAIGQRCEETLNGFDSGANGTPSGR